MSSGSSEIDVIRTRIPAYDDDNTVLYAYEPNTAFTSTDNLLADIEVPPKTVTDVLDRCQIIEETLQNLSRKCDQILGKVSKIYRCRVKSLWQGRKPFGYAYKNYNYLLARKLKFQRRRRRRRGLSESFSHPESYSPTVPVGRRDDRLSFRVRTPYNSDDSQLPPESPFREQPIREQVLEKNLNQNPAIFQHAFQPYIPTTDEEMRPCMNTSAPYPSPGLHSTSTNLSPTRPSSVVHTSMLSSEEGCLTQNTSCLTQNTSFLAPNTSCLTQNTSFLAPNTSCLAPSTSYLTQNPKMISYASLMEDKHCGSPRRVPRGFATSSPLHHDRDRLKPIFSVDPSTWSVEDVVTFLKQTDVPMSNLISDLVRHHDIDGKALLLLKSDMMMQYMGLKLGTAVKLCYYIERLKEQKYYDI
ncbi:sex comb on midleg-like protein 1 [Otolemur garnettii]|uniref:sex comb on midleg-like protein 1 n=1 Tax=Otolemur garnettii TaxID=30611 RepID=UPI000C7EA691|nr:sex comb on midleg-like protein 1 [Otolemur garnettii]